MERRRIQGLPKVFWVTPIITGTDKTTDFKFGGYIYRANGNKSPLKILEKGSVDVSRDCQNFSGTSYYLRSGYSYRLQILYEHS